MLLVNDGSVTRLLEACLLEPLTVKVIDQRVIETGDRGSFWLDLAPAMRSAVRRRVAIVGSRSNCPHALAESLLVPWRLPATFTDSLTHSSKGLGEVVDHLRLETRRELLWFGGSGPPGWGDTSAIDLQTVMRSYRFIIAGGPAILTTESFSNRRRA